MVFTSEYRIPQGKQIINILQSWNIMHIHLSLNNLCTLCWKWWVLMGIYLFIEYFYHLSSFLKRWSGAGAGAIDFFASSAALDLSKSQFAKFFFQPRLGTLLNYLILKLRPIILKYCIDSIKLYQLLIINVNSNILVASFHQIVFNSIQFNKPKCLGMMANHTHTLPVQSSK